MSYMSSEMIYDDKKGMTFTGSIVDDDGNTFKTDTLEEYYAAVELYEHGASVLDLNEIQCKGGKTENDEEPACGDCSNDCAGKCACKQEDPAQDEEEFDDEELLDDDEVEPDGEDDGEITLTSTHIINVSIPDMLVVAGAVLAGVAVFRRLFRR